MDCTLLFSVLGAISSTVYQFGWKYMKQFDQFQSRLPPDLPILSLTSHPPPATRIFGTPTFPLPSLHLLPPEPSPCNHVPLVIFAIIFIAVFLPALYFRFSRDPTINKLRKGTPCALRSPLQVATIGNKSAKAESSPIEPPKQPDSLRLAMRTLLSDSPIPSPRLRTSSLNVLTGRLCRKRLSSSDWNEKESKRRRIGLFELRSSLQVATIEKKTAEADSSPIAPPKQPDGLLLAMQPLLPDSSIPSPMGSPMLRAIDSLLRESPKPSPMGSPMLRAIDPPLRDSPKPSPVGSPMLRAIDPPLPHSPIPSPRLRKLRHSNMLTARQRKRPSTSEWNERESKRRRTGSFVMQRSPNLAIDPPFPGSPKPSPIGSPTLPPSPKSPLTWSSVLDIELPPLGTPSPIGSPILKSSVSGTPTSLASERVPQLRTDWAEDTDDEFDVGHALMNLPWLQPSVEEQVERQSSSTDTKQDAGVTSFVKENSGELVGDISRFDNASNAYEPRDVSGDFTTHLSEETTGGEHTESTGGDLAALLSEEPSGVVSTNPLATEPSGGDLVAPLSEEPFGGASTTLSATEPSEGVSNALLSIDTAGSSTAPQVETSGGVLTTPLATEPSGGVSNALLSEDTSGNSTASRAGPSHNSSQRSLGVPKGNGLQSSKYASKELQASKYASKGLQASKYASPSLPTPASPPSLPNPAIPPPSPSNTLHPSVDAFQPQQPDPVVGPAVGTVPAAGPAPVWLIKNMAAHAELAQKSLKDRTEWLLNYNKERHQKRWNRNGHPIAQPAAFRSHGAPAGPPTTARAWYVPPVGPPHGAPAGPPTTAQGWSVPPVGPAPGAPVGLPTTARAWYGPPAGPPPRPPGPTRPNFTQRHTTIQGPPGSGKYRA